MKRARRRAIMRYDDIVMLILALVSGILLILELTLNLNAEEMYALDTIDLGIAITFLCEFTIKLLTARKKIKFLQDHWWDLLAAIPVTTPFTEALRLLRILRIVLHLRLIEKERETLFKR